MMRAASAIGALILCFTLGCDKKEAPPAPAEQASVAAAPAAAAPEAAPAQPTVDAASLPVEEQYEAEAEQEISAANLQAKLDALEKEIAEP